MSEKSGQDPLQDEQSPQTVEPDQLKTERSKLKTERAKQKTERAKLKTERAKLKTERSKLNAVQGPQKSEQAPKKDNSRLFGLLEKTLMFLATLAVPVGACLWSEFFSMSSLEKIVAGSFFAALVIAVCVILVILIKMSSRG